jgi:magnesium chelatase family protein
MLATVASAALLGVDGHPVAVEVHATDGLPCFTVVGQPDGACREARDRVRAAIESSGLRWQHRRFTVNLAPTGLRKAGAGLDLAIAVAVLAATERLPLQAVAGMGFVGELGLDGGIRPVPGVLSLVDAVDAPAVVVPTASSGESGLVQGRQVHPAPDLATVIACLTGQRSWPQPAAPVVAPAPSAAPDLAEVRGQPLARRALEVAAAGGHHLLMVGPPGGGKSMLAQRLPGILPDLTDGQVVEASRVRSAAGLPPVAGGVVRRPPLRAPHHSSSAVALIGGGSARLQPGEVSMAHHGLLFLDELAEFAPAVLDALRQPLEEGVVRVARADVRATLPARFLLVGAMNPCPCGMRGAPGSCRCSDDQLARYCRRVSGPLLDRFDLRIDVPRADASALLGADPGEPSAAVAERVARARRLAAERGVVANAELSTAALDRWAPLAPDAVSRLDRELRRGRLSGRGLQRVRRVARTLADLAGCEGPVSADQIGAALQLRQDPSFVVERMAS